MAEKKRPPVRIKFKYNKETGEIEEFLIDDNAPAASENYHDKVARSIAGQLARDPEIQDAGLVRHREIIETPLPETPKDKKEKEEKESQE